MGYNIEISFDISKHNNITDIKTEITNLALDYNCENYYYYNCEYDESHKFPRNHYIIAVEFNDNNIFDCSNFLKLIKKQPGIHIECIYEDENDIKCKLIYASKYYLKQIDKSCVIVYNKFKRERSHSDNEKIILANVTK